MRQNIFHGEFERMLIGAFFNFKVDTRTLGGAVVIAKGNVPLLNFDPNGANRNVDFPAPDSDMEGTLFLVNNFAGGAFDLVCRNSAAVTILTVSQAEAGVVFYAGGVTYGRLLGTIT